MAYVELHCHSGYSFLDGASTPNELAHYAHALGHSALALTDTDGLYGAMEFAKAASAWGVRPIIGAEVTLAGPDGSRPRMDRPAEGYRLLLLVENAHGYANLCRLITAAHLAHEKDEPALDPALLATHANGLICLTGSPDHGEVARLASAGDLDGARAALARLVEWFGHSRIYVELQHHYAPGDRNRNERLVALARDCGLAVVATNDVHYHAPDRRRLQDVLVAIRTHQPLDACHRERFPNGEYYLKSEAEIRAAFADWPEAIEHTGEVAERCRFDIESQLTYRFPDYPTPQGEPPDAYLRAVCEATIRDRYSTVTGAVPPNVQARLEEELRLIARHRLAGFFLIYRDLIEEGKQVLAELRAERGDPTPVTHPPGRGRGSSVGSLVCYLIGLSHIDPIANDLFLGRFLNEEMAAVPDIDLDFSREVRERMIARVYERWGRDHVALTCTFPTYRTRGAIREVGKALGLPAPALDKLAKLAARTGVEDLPQEMARLPEFRDQTRTPMWRHFFRLVQEIHGLPRHVSQHVGGMIISSTPLVKCVPLENSRMPGRVVCQWDKDSIDDARFIKIDFLALGMLSAVDECLDRIRARTGKSVDLSRIDFADPRVYAAIQAGDTVGTFQVESRAQIQSIIRTRPENLEDLTVQVAIIRPGPIVGGAVNPYINRRMGRELVTYDHPLLEPALKETLGVVLYQEQVLEVVMAIGGFSPGQADQMRRAMRRKRSFEAMAEFWEAFRAGAAERGIARDLAETIFRKLLGFAEFGFPKSHAAAFGLLAYQSNWLRVHYPAEYLAALLNAQPMDFYSPEVLVGDAKRHEVPLLAPDINRSTDRCAPEGEGVRLGLAMVRSIGETPAKTIVQERDRYGAYGSLFDLYRRVPLRREGIEALIEACAFDWTGLERRELLWQVGLFYQPVAQPAGEAARTAPRPRQLPLALPTVQDQPPLRPMSRWERLVADYRALGLSTVDHPMAALRNWLDQLHEGVVRVAGLEEMAADGPVTIAGLVVCRQQPETAKGFIFLLLEDETGLANIVVSPQVHKQFQELVRLEPFVVVHGDLERKDGVTNVIGRSLERLEVPPEMVAPEAHSFH